MIRYRIFYEGRRKSDLAKVYGFSREFGRYNDRDREKRIGRREFKKKHGVGMVTRSEVVMTEESVGRNFPHARRNVRLETCLNDLKERNEENPGFNL